MYHITKEFTFAAAHSLNTLPEDHKCHRLHGHNYVVQFELSSALLNEHGFVQDFGDLAPIKRYIDDVIDHRDLNKVLNMVSPSAEMLAAYFADMARSLMKFNDGVTLTRVTVWETATSAASWEPL